MRKPGALRNGAPLKDWDLPAALVNESAQSSLTIPHGDRQFVKVLSLVPERRA